MYIQVRHQIFKKTPEHLSLLQVWDIRENELSPIGCEAIDILDKGDLKDANLYKEAAWSGSAIQEFQDLLDLTFPKTGRFFNVHYLFFESLSAFRESVLSGLNGQLQASLAVLRAGLEMFTFHLWWRERLRFEDSFEPFYDWLFGLKGSPPFKNVIDSVFENPDMPLSGTTKDTFDALYGKLCAYAHKPLIDQAITSLKGTNLTIVNTEVLYFWLDLLQNTQRVVLDLAVSNSPMCLFPLPLHTKFGFNPPVGVFFDKANFLSLEMSLGAERLKSYQDHFRSREPVVTLLPWFNGFPDRSEREILSSWADGEPLGHEGKSFEERVFLGFGMQKAKMRALLMGFAYKPNAPSIESLYRPPQI
jgi:hypothetical protein